MIEKIDTLAEKKRVYVKREKDKEKYRKRFIAVNKAERRKLEKEKVNHRQSKITYIYIYEDGL